MGEYGVITEIDGPWRDINRPPLLFYGIDPRTLWVFVFWLLVPTMLTFVLACTVLVGITLIERKGWTVGMAFRRFQVWVNDGRLIAGAD